MKKQSFKIWMIGIIFLIIISFLMASQITHSKNALMTYSDSHYRMKFIDALYLDADQDGYEDDTQFLVELTFDTMIFDGRTIKLNCFFEIITPSNNSYEYSGFIIMDCVNCIICFDVYNTVTEAGWYTINFHSNFQYKGSVYSSFCTTIFDPPTEGTEGTSGPGISI